jgi:hypothetical protein
MYRRSRQQSDADNTTLDPTKTKILTRQPMKQTEALVTQGMPVTAALPDRAEMPDRLAPPVKQVKQAATTRRTTQTRVRIIMVRSASS